MENVWKLLSEHAKYKTIQQQANTKPSEGSIIDLNTPNTDNRNERPIGRKAAKTENKLMNDKVAGQDPLTNASVQMAASTQEMVALMKRRTMAMEEHNKQAIMGFPTHKLCDEAQEYYRFKRAKIMANLQKNEHSNPSPDK